MRLRPTVIKGGESESIWLPCVRAPELAISIWYDRIDNDTQRHLHLTMLLDSFSFQAQGHTVVCRFADRGTDRSRCGAPVTESIVCFFW